MATAYLGEIRIFAGTTPPKNWLPCDGRTLSASEYSALYSLIGATYGGSASSFNLPDLRGRVPVHMGAAQGLTPRSLGQADGQEQVTLTTAMMPVHSHTLSGVKSPATSVSPANNLLAVTQAPQAMYWPARETGTQGNLGANTVAGNSQFQNQPHTNMQPSIALTIMMCVAGIWPSSQG